MKILTVLLIRTTNMITVSLLFRKVYYVLDKENTDIMNKRSTLLMTSVVSG